MPRRARLAAAGLALLGAGVLFLVFGVIPARLGAQASPATPPMPGPTIVAAPAIPPALTAPFPLATPTAQPTVLTHQVAEGETLAAIARTHHLSVQTLLSANAIVDPDRLRVDDELAIPAADGLLYTVQPGDSLHAIAEKAGVTIRALLDANKLSEPDSLLAETDLLVPGDAAQLAAALDPDGQSAASTGRNAPGKRGTVTYEVQPGDSLVVLGTKFGVDLDTLLAANEIDDPDTIRPGTVLRILPVSGVEHVVQPGERLGDIAARYKTDAGLIFDFNDLPNPDLIRPGERLLIPGGRRSASQPVAPAAAAAPATPAPKPAPAARPAAPAVPVPSSGPLGARVAAIAQQYVGAAYVWGGTGPNGFDCSGLVWYVLKQAGAPVSRGLWGQYDAGQHVSRDALQPGDIVFFQNTYMPGLSHDGIYIGNGLMVNAVDEASGVKIQSIDSAYWSSRWFGATRVR